MSSTVGMLLEMGFSQKRAEEAVEKTGNSGVEAAMEWLITHEESPPSTTTDTPDENKESSSVPADAASELKANSFKCEDCGKLLKNMDDAELHATRTGHANFSESSEDVKPLTEEEKQAQLLRVNELLKQKRKEREERERQQQLELEHSRRKIGKEISMAKQKHEEVEIKKILDQRKRDKEDEKRTLQKVREQIEKDKKDREAKFGMAGSTAEATPVVVPQPVLPPVTTPSVEYTETKLQVRLLDGSKLVESFKVEESLAAVRLFVQQKSPLLTSTRFSFSTPFPRKDFSDEDMQTSLKELGLVPSAVLMVKKSV